MRFNAQAVININNQAILNKVKNDKFGLFVALEWKKLIDLYTPQHEGFLIGKRGTVHILPFALHYLTPYADYLYNSEGFDFYKELSPYATDHWDQKADQAGQKDRLIQIINAALQRGYY